MKQRIIGLSVVFFITFLSAQAPDTLWTKTFGGGAWDKGYSVQQTTDGGYIITGFTGSFGLGNSDVWLLKTDSLGDTLWTQTYGDSAQDHGHSVQQTTDGGYIITGEKGFFNDIYLIKTDSLGNTLWTQEFEGDYGSWGTSVQQTTDGGYILTGHKNTTGAGTFAFLIKTDPFGDTLWTRDFSGNGGAGGQSVQQTADAGYIITGYSSDPTGVFMDAYLVKTDSSGDTLWTRTYGEGGSEQEKGYSVQQTTDGGYIITGYKGLYDVYLVKTDSRGDTLWTRTFGGGASDHGMSVQQTADGGYVITGVTRSYGAGSADSYLIKTDSLGDTLWTSTFGGSNTDGGYSVQQTTDGGYIIVGETWSYGAGSGDVYLIKIAPETGVEEKKINQIPQNDINATVFSGPLVLPEGRDYRIFDITGRVVIPNKIEPGIYFIEVDGNITQKVVKIK